MTQQFKKNAGIKTVFETVTNILRGDGVLKGLINYTPATPNIRRGFQTTGSWEKLIIYWLQPEIMMLDFHPNFRQVPLLIGIYARENELQLYDIGERIIQLLDSQNDADLSKEGYLKVYSSIYDGEVGGLTYDIDTKAYFRTIRFILTIRKE